MFGFKLLTLVSSITLASTFISGCYRAKVTKSSEGATKVGESPSMPENPNGPSDPSPLPSVSSSPDPDASPEPSTLPSPEPSSSPEPTSSPEPSPSPSPSAPPYPAPQLSPLSSVNFSTRTHFQVTGDCSNLGETILISASDSLTAVSPASPPTCDPSQTPNWSSTFDVSSLRDGTLTVSVKSALDPAQQTNSRSTAKDTVAPTLVSLERKTPSNSPAADPNPSFRATGISEDSTLSLYSNGNCIGSPARTNTVSVGDFDIALSNLSDGDYTYGVQLQDAFGNLSLCTSSVTYTVNSALFTAPALSFFDPQKSPDSKTKFTFKATQLVSGSVLKIYSAAGCTGTLIQSLPVTGGLTETLVDVLDLSEASHTFSALQTNSSIGRTSTCSNSLTYVVDLSFPNVTVASDQATYFLGGNTTATLSGACSEVGQPVNVFWNSSPTAYSPAPTCPAGKTWSLSFPLTSAIAEGTVSFKASQTNLAGSEGTGNGTLLWDQTSPVISSAFNHALFPLESVPGPLSQQSNVTFTATAMDPTVEGQTSNSSFTSCTYIVVGQSVSPSPTPCTSLTGAAWTQSDTGVTLPQTKTKISWTPTTTQVGTYKFTLTAKDSGGNASSADYFVSVRENTSKGDLLACYDALFSNFGTDTPLQSAPSVPRLTNNLSSSWKALVASAAPISLTALSSNSSWQGSGTTANPYALYINGSASDSLALDNPLSTSTRISASAWVKPFSAATSKELGKVIFGNKTVSDSDSTSLSDSGFVLRQSSNHEARIEFIGTKNAGPDYSGYREAVLRDRPVAYWPLDEAKSADLAEDIGASAITGNYEGADATTGWFLQRGLPGGVGNGIRINASSDPANPRSDISWNTDNTSIWDDQKDILNIGGKKLSIEAWGKRTTASSSDASYITFFSRYLFGATSTQYELTWTPATPSGIDAGKPNQLRLSVMRVGGMVDCYSTLGVTDVTNWHHFAATYDAGTGAARFYADGADIGTTCNSGTSDSLKQNSTYVNYIGASKRSPTFTVGYIDEVAVYASTLTLQQVKNHYDVAKNGKKVYPANGIVADKPIRYYRLGEKSGNTAYELVGNYNGTYTPANGFTLGQTGVTAAHPSPVPLPIATDYDSSVALTYANAGNVQASPSGLPTGAAPRSISLWVKPNSMQTAALEARALVSWGADAQNAATMYALEYYKNDYLTLRLRTSLTNGGSYNVDFSPGTDTTGAPYRTGVWQHIVVTFDGTYYRAYVNGQPFYPGRTKPLIVQPTVAIATTLGTNFRIGGYPTTTTTGFKTFDGVIDEVAIYDYALSPTQVAYQFKYPSWWYCQTTNPLSSSWSLLEAMHDGTFMRIFTNGTEECRIKTTNPYMPTTSDMMIGAMATSGGSKTSFWNGILSVLNFFGSSANPFRGGAPDPAATPTAVPTLPAADYSAQKGRFGL